MSNKRVSIIGLGYVGLSTAVCFSSRGIKVIGHDIDKSKIELLEKGIPTIHEKDLESILRKSLKEGNISFTSDIDYAIKNSDISFITVGTPSKEDGSIDLTFVKDASTEIAKVLKDKNDWHLIVVKSTVIPGTTEQLVKETIEKISGKRCGEDFGLCMNPEFLREGSAIQDTFHPDRLIIGEYDKKSGDALESFFKGFYGKEMPPTLRTSLINAELIKYANNAFLAMKVSFINMISNLCQHLPNADVEDVALGIGYDKRIGNQFLKAGIGWGGSCFPKDLKALRNFARSLNLDLPLVDSTILVNDFQISNVISILESRLGEIKGKKVAVLGLAFKAGTDDVRESVPIKLVKELINKGAYVKVYDPVAMKNSEKILKNLVYYSNSPLDCIAETDCAIIATEWEEFKKISPKDFRKLMRRPLVVDGRRIYDPKKYEEEVEFVAIGRGNKDLIIPKQKEKISLNPSLAVNAIVDINKKVLLVKRKIEPYKGLWSLPGGFVEYGETLENAVRREVNEETGLVVEPVKIIGAYSDPNRHPGRHVVSICYLVKVVSGSIKPDLEENEIVKFFDYNEIPSKLAFDHAKMLEDYMKLKEK